MIHHSDIMGRSFEVIGDIAKMQRLARAHIGIPNLDQGAGTRIATTAAFGRNADMLIAGLVDFNCLNVLTLLTTIRAQFRKRTKPWQCADELHGFATSADNRSLRIKFSAAAQHHDSRSSCVATT